jgi:hypothetical protein
VWHVFVPGVGSGQAYGYRATGLSDADSAASVPRSLGVAGEPFRWRAGAHPGRPYPAQTGTQITRNG